MNCASFKENAWAFALDALEPAERTACEAHLSAPGPHEGCREAMAEAFEAAATLASATPAVIPPRGAFARIEQQLAPRAPGPAPRPSVPARSTGRWVPWAIAAAAVLAAGASFWRAQHTAQTVAGIEKDRDTTVKVLETCQGDLKVLKDTTEANRAAVALLEQEGTVLVPMGPQPEATGRGTTLYNAKLGKAVLVATGLQIVPDRDYELWVIHDGKQPVAAGLLRPDGSGRAVAEFDPDQLGAGVGAFAISREAKGGSVSGKPGTVLFVGSAKG